MKATSAYVSQIVGDALPQLSERRPGPTLLFSLVTVTVLAGAGALAALAPSWWLCVPCWILQAIAMVGCSNAAHECTHGLYTRSRGLNRLAGSLWMMPLFLNFGVHRNYHLQHHRLTTQKGDPEFNFDYQRFPSLRKYALAPLKTLLTRPLLRLNLKATVRSMLGREAAFVPNAKERLHTNLNGLLLLLWGAVVTLATIHWPIIMLRAYLIPYAVFLPLTAWYTAVPEHYMTEPGCDATRNTRTIDCNAVLSCLLWYFNIHTAHHLAPSVPFYNLPQLDRLIRDHVAFRAPSYTRFHADVIRTIVAGRSNTGAGHETGTR